jgi:hypothetical protein
LKQKDVPMCRQWADHAVDHGTEMMHRWQQKMWEREREQEYVADGFFLMHKLRRWRQWVVLIHAVRGRGDHSVMRFMIRRWQERKNARQLARDTLMQMFSVSAHWQKHAALHRWEQETKAAYALRFWYSYLKTKYFAQWRVLLRLRDTFAGKMMRLRPGREALKNSSVHMSCVTIHYHTLYTHTPYTVTHCMAHTL